MNARGGGGGIIIAVIAVTTTIISLALAITFTIVTILLPPTCPTRPSSVAAAVAVAVATTAVANHVDETERESFRVDRDEDVRLRRLDRLRRLSKPAS